jgi:hypothetical protein
LIGDFNTPRGADSIKIVALFVEPVRIVE